MGFFSGLSSKNKVKPKAEAKVMSEEMIEKSIQEFRSRVEKIKEESCKKPCSLGMDLLLDEMNKSEEMVIALEAMISKYEAIDKECAKTNDEIARMEAEMKKLSL
jgi:predicted transcriptional regulator